MWNLPNLNDDTSTGMTIPPSVVEVSYKVIQERIVEPKLQPLQIKEINHY